MTIIVTSTSYGNQYMPPWSWNWRLYVLLCLYRRDCSQNAKPGTSMGARQGPVVRIWQCYRDRLVTGSLGCRVESQETSILFGNGRFSRAGYEGTHIIPLNAPETCGHSLDSLSCVSKWLLLWAINASLQLWLFFWKRHYVYSIIFIPIHQASSQKIT